MSRPQKVNFNEWLDELAKLSRKDDLGLTVREWAERLGKSQQTVNEMLRRAKAQGWLMVGRRTTEALDGRIFQAVVYRVVKPNARRAS